MSTALLAPGVPRKIAAKFKSHEVEWEPGWGDRATHTCLHGALLKPCAIPGDEILWSVLLSARGLTIEWNDEQATVEPIIAALTDERGKNPTRAEMEKVFGPDWMTARHICRTWATATPEQKRAAWAAWAARDAFVAVCMHRFCKEGADWDEAAYQRLIGPWVKVFGPLP